jgi:hypothetical protein
MKPKLGIVKKKLGREFHKVPFFAGNCSHGFLDSRPDCLREFFRFASSIIDGLTKLLGEFR